MIAAAAATFADPSWFALHNPLAHPLHFAGLELAVGAAFVLTLRHAVSALRGGDHHPLFQWLVGLAYGVLMELIAFNYLDNYDHGTFTVQLYHGKLPLYVVLVYPVFHYTGIQLVGRWRLGLLREALLTGFAICLLDIPFDLAGPDAGWWTWSGRDPNLAVRWLGVPVNSYYWYLLFGAAYAVLCRLLRTRVHSWGLLRASWLVPLVAVAMIALGTLLFQPLHLLQKLGSADTPVVAAHLALCIAVMLATAPANAPGLPRPLHAIPVLLDTWHVGLILALAVLGLAADAALKIAMALAASAALLGLTFGWPAPLARAEGHKE